MTRSAIVFSSILLLTACASQKISVEGSNRLAIAVSSNRQLDTESCGCSAQNLGGVEREANLISQKRNSRPNLLYFAVGTSFVPLETGYNPSEKENYRRRAEVVAELNEKLGVTALAPSARDLSLGRSSIESLAGKVKYPFLSANIVDKASGQPIFKRFWKTEVAGTPVLVTALTSPSELAADNDGSLTILPPDEALLGVLKDNDSRFVILLSSLTPKDRDQVLEKFPQVHVVLGGAEPPHTLDANLRNKKQIIYNPMSRGRQVGFLELDVKMPFAGFYNQDTADFVNENRETFMAEEAELLKKKKSAATKARLKEIQASLRGLDRWSGARWEGVSEYWSESVTVSAKFGGKNSLSSLAEKARSLSAK